MFQPGGPTFIELTRQALASTVAGYDLIAPTFDKTPFRTPDVVLQQVAARIGPTSSVGRALDVCCGTGAGVIMLRPLCTEEVVGIDFSAGMLTEARRRSSGAAGRAKLSFVHGNAFELPYDNEFDVVTCFGAFGHIQRQEQPAFLDGVHRALQPGGRFVFVTSTRPSRRGRVYWMYKSFNAVMRVRNALLKPPFIMYYLNFLVPDILPMFDRVGFDVALHDVRWERRSYKIAVATKRSQRPPR